MVRRGMEIKDLVNSQLFYAPLWTRCSLFSTMEEDVILPYNEPIEELEFEDPNLVFKDYGQHGLQQKKDTKDQ